MIEKYPYTVDGPYVHPVTRARRAVVGWLVRMSFYLAFTAAWVWLLLKWWSDNP